jgi:hypothetical protein
MFSADNVLRSKQTCLCNYSLFLDAYFGFVGLNIFLINNIIKVGGVIVDLNGWTSISNLVDLEWCMAHILPYTPIIFAVQFFCKLTNSMGDLQQKKKKKKIYGDFSL